MIDGSRISVTDVATALNLPSLFGKRLRLANTGAASIDLGDVGVLTGAGYELGAAETLEVELAPGDQLFGISAAAASNEVHVLVT